MHLLLPGNDMEKMLQAMWPLLALKFRQQLGRDVVKGKAGRQLPTGHVPASARHRLPGLPRPSARAALGEVAAPGKEAAPGRWSCGSAGNWAGRGERRGSDPAARSCWACRLPRRPGSRSIIPTGCCWERQVVFLGEGWGVRMGLSQFLQSPQRSLLPGFPPQTQSGLG